MNRGLDEVVTDLSIDVDQIKEKWQRLVRRMDLSVKRLKTIESRLEKIDKRLDDLESNNR